MASEILEIPTRVKIGVQEGIRQSAKRRKAKTLQTINTSAWATLVATFTFRVLLPPADAMPKSPWPKPRVAPPRRALNPAGWLPQAPNPNPLALFPKFDVSLGAR